MVALALAVTLAAPPASMPRVPGMRLRLGMSESQVLALGSFAEVKVPDAGMTARRGPGRFFGVPGEVTCYLRDGTLAEVRFEANDVSTHSQDYVDGQLRMAQLARACQSDETANRVCDWTSSAILVHTEMKKDRLTARAVRWPRAQAAVAPDSLRAGRTATRPAAPDSLRATGAAGAATSAPPPAAPPHPDTTARATEPVATLPETLTISLASRNAPGVWPRIVSSPTLHYPESARRESLQGVVWVRALVDPAGRVLEASVERGIRELNESALAWVRGSQFAACRRDGAPCRFWVRVAVLFTLY